jgi:hypothetical protein
MVKPLFTLATRLLSTNGSLVCNLTRIRGGFLPRENLEQAKRHLADLQNALQEIEVHLSTSHASPPSGQIRTPSPPSSPLGV